MVVAATAKEAAEAARRAEMAEKAKAKQATALAQAAEEAEKAKAKESVMAAAAAAAAQDAEKAYVSSLKFKDVVTARSHSPEPESQTMEIYNAFSTVVGINVPAHLMPTAVEDSKKAYESHLEFMP